MFELDLWLIGPAVRTVHSKNKFWSVFNNMIDRFWDIKPITPCSLYLTLVTLTRSSIWILMGLIMATQMVNTRAGSSSNVPNPPPLTFEQILAMQAQLLNTVNNAVQALANAQAHPPPPQHKDRRGDFMKGRPPTFSHSTEPLQADDWLRDVERQLDIAQCNDHERVLYGAGQLRGAALQWWESYTPQDREAVTWAQFRERFRNHHVPAGIMKMKKKEFLALKQEGMSVTEYRDKFLQLSRYAPNEVANDDDKQEHFLEGLNDALQYQLMNHTFPSFHDLVNRALLTERKRKDMDERKRKLSSTPSGSNTRPRYQQQHQHQHQYQPQGQQQRNQGQQGYQQRQGQHVA